MPAALHEAIHTHRLHLRRADRPLGRADHAWTVKLRYSDCAAVFAACAKVDVPLPTPPPKTWRLTCRGEAEAEERGRHLARYLSRVVASEKCWALSSVKELFGVSTTTFDEELGEATKLEVHVSGSSKQSSHLR